MSLESALGRFAIDDGLKTGGKTMLSGFSHAGSKIWANGERLLSGAHTTDIARDTKVLDRAAKYGDETAKTATKTATKEGTKATEDAAKTAGKETTKGHKILKGGAKLAGKGALAAGGAALSAGGKAVSGTAKTLLGKKGGVSSLLKLGTFGLLLKLLMNPAFTKGLGQGLGNLTSQTTGHKGTQTVNSSASVNHFNDNLTAATNSTAPTANAAAANTTMPTVTNLPSTGNLGKDNYRTTAVQNMGTVIAQNQAQNVQQKQTENGADLAR